MPAAIIEPILFWQVHQPLLPRPATPAAPGAPRSSAPSPAPPAEPGAPPAPAGEVWRSQPFARAAQPGAARRRATRYEKFTTRIVVVSSVLTLGVTASLHVVNYDLETKTSSTSGTHSGFYKEDE